ncbi:Polyhomeotic-Like Protein 1 [Manis pentadactyla]|nr:Polyhomeotic-Like Protein 1 [Manis pentadactyla]
MNGGSQLRTAGCCVQGKGQNGQHFRKAGGNNALWEVCNTGSMTETKKSPELSAPRVLTWPKCSSFPEIGLRIICYSNLNKRTHMPL